MFRVISVLVLAIVLTAPVAAQAPLPQRGCECYALTCPPSADNVPCPAVMICECRVYLPLILK